MIPSCRKPIRSRWVDSIRQKLPELQETIPAAIDLQNVQIAPTIRASLEEVEQTLIISVALVILVVFLFLRSGQCHYYSRRCGAGFADWHVCGDVPVRIQSQ